MLEKLRIMSTALIVIDAQESFRQRPDWQLLSHPDLVGDINRLVTAARANGDQVYWILHTEPGSGTVFDPTTGHVRLLDGLQPQAREAVISKTAHNAFTTTNLQQHLTMQCVQELIVCGIRTEQCCETTARLASDLGYDVTFAIDATATTPRPHRDAPAGQTIEQLRDDPRTLGTAEIIARTEYALAGRFATIRTVDEIVGSPRGRNQSLTPSR